MRESSSAPRVTIVVSRPLEGLEDLQEFPDLKQTRSVADVAGRAALIAGGSILTLGLIGLWLRQPLLFASLGPTIYGLATEPYKKSSQFYNVVVGHVLALLIGCLVVLALGAHLTPSVFDVQELTSVRIWAAALAVLIALPAEVLLRASHPPAAATILLITLGGFNPSLRDATIITVGVLLTATIGVAIRRVIPHTQPRLTTVEASVERLR
jgi:hypothetical protein